MSPLSYRIWEEPVRGAYPGIEFMGFPGVDRIQRSREIMPPPPTHHLTGFHPTSGGYGYSEFELPASDWFLTNAGIYPGGMLVFLADAPLGGAIMSVVPPGHFTTTSELSMNFLRPASPASGPLRARGQLIQAGKTLGLSEVSVSDASGRLLAHGTTRCPILSMDPVPPHPGDAFRAETPSYDTPDPWQRTPVPGGVVSADVVDRMTGLELLQAAIDGELPSPPYAHLFATDLVEARDGEVVCTTRMNEWMHSPARNVYGGVTGLIADHALTAAVWSTLPRSSTAATLDLKVQYLRPVFGDGSDLTTRATVVHRGRTIAVARAELINAQGKVVALATGSSMITPDRRWGPMRAVAPADDGGSADLD